VAVRRLGFCGAVARSISPCSARAIERLINVSYLTARGHKRAGNTVAS
jgi:hypothetical protein